MATKVYELIAPCHFGLEAVLKKEILDLGYEISQVEDGKVTFWGDAEAICRANIFLRTTERILLKVGSFKATTLGAVPGDQGAAVGGVHPAGWPFLGQEGQFHQE